MNKRMILIVVCVGILILASCGMRQSVAVGPDSIEEHVIDDEISIVDSMEDVLEPSSAPASSGEPSVLSPQDSENRKGYEAGNRVGYTDGYNGSYYQANYSPDSDFDGEGKYFEDYRRGYESGYCDGYNSGSSDCKSEGR